jgi:hypothetical protein
MNKQYKTTRISIDLPRLVAIDFEKAGKVQEKPMKRKKFIEHILIKYVRDCDTNG